MPPPEWGLSRLCEEFGCLPSQAVRELENTPVGLVADIMELRAYTRAKEVIDHAQREEDIPQSPMIDLVFEIESEIIKEQKAKHGR